MIRRLLAPLGLIVSLLAIFVGSAQLGHDLSHPDHTPMVVIR